MYVIEEEAQLTDGVYEAELEHDNINVATFAVYTGPKLTGERLDTYTLSTPSLTPWKRIARVYADVSPVYLSYETEGDTVEAADVNELQEAVAGTQEALNSEEERAIAAEQRLSAGLTAEANRAKAAEQALAEGLADEAARASGAEKTNADNLNAEVARAKKAESDINTALTAEASRAKAKETEIENTVTTNKQETDRELANRYTKEEVLERIGDLIGSAPEALDTLKEIADALGNDPDFAATMITLLGGKVDKEPGKGLSESDYTAAEKEKLARLPETITPATQADWDASDPDSPAFVKNKPTGLSAFRNDAGYLQGGVMTWGDLMGGGG